MPGIQAEQLRAALITFAVPERLFQFAANDTGSLAGARRQVGGRQEPRYPARTMRGFFDYATVPHDWRQIVESTASLAAANAAFVPVADVAAWLADSDFRNAGLCGVMSMHELIIGPSTAVLANPYLVISYSPNRDVFDLRYEDGSQTPWTREAGSDEIRHVLERFLTKRARWYSARNAG